MTDTTDTRYPREQADPGLQAVYPLYNAKGWLKFLGILAIINGALTALSIVGVLIAWLPIWMGVLAVQASGRYRDAIEAGDREAATEASRKLQTAITVAGVAALVWLVVMGIMLFSGAIFGFMGGMTGGHRGGHW